MLMAVIKEILLTNVCRWSAEFRGKLVVVIDNQTDTRLLRHGQNRFGHAPDFREGFVLGAQLDEVRAAIAKLLSEMGGSAAMQVSRIDKRIEAAIRQRFHAHN